MIIADTKAPIETLVNNLIKPFPVNLEEAIGEKSVRVHAIEMRKNSAMPFIFVTFAIKSQSSLHYTETVYIPLIHRE